MMTQKHAQVFTARGLPEMGIITTLVKMTGSDIRSDENPLLYWDIDATYSSDCCEDEMMTYSHAAADDDQYSYTPSSLSLGSCSVEVLLDKRPTKLGGLRDKLRGSIKHNLGFFLHNEKWIFDGLYLIALGHHKIRAARSKTNAKKY